MTTGEQVRLAARRGRSADKGQNKMTDSTTVQLSCEADDLIAALEQLLSEFTEGSPEIRERLLDFFCSTGEAGLIEIDSVAASADEMVVRLNPSYRLRMLLAALRAGDLGRGHLIQSAGHDEVPLSALK